MDAVLNLSLPAPINVIQISADMEKSYATAAALADEITNCPEVNDVFIPRMWTHRRWIAVNRQYASDIGLSQKSGQ